ncbi:hypothetical protein SAMN02800687_2908 [Curtobacterium sp. UNCCL20]|uniref:hypothetical protein n=1 Tax=Curtobacterium sp. UNCCL20 TaxID=1502773 RepID=UPI000891703A|nr:hypothetical protein [Curtobacterium sp. UNCCL20]SDQ87163.1 hypothetical protein SAMN02800687_2908 [Curtobacterium sp. UNCCL20]
MIPVTTRTHPAAGVRYPREIAAAITLPAACAALVAPGADPLPRAGAVAVLTACGALAPRFTLIAFLADPDHPDPRALTAFDPFHDPTPPALSGAGPAPDRPRLRIAGDRLAGAWQWWRTEDPSADTATGAAGALAMASWCAWALGSAARAQTRAQYALETRSDDPLAGLVLRSVRAGSAPSWERR